MTVVLTAGEGQNVLDRLEQPRLVLVEGSDDQAVLAALIKHESLEGFHIHNMIGKDKWSGKIRAICRTIGFGKVVGLGLVRDADDNGQRAFDSCREALRAAGLAVPTDPESLAPGRPAVAIAIVPDMNTQGAIEDVCLPSFDPMNMSCVDSYFDCLSVGADRAAKATVQAYLAGLQPRCKDLNVAAREGSLNLDHSAFDSLREFLMELNSA